MGKTIWKYELEITDTQEIEIPERATMLSVMEQNGKLCLWVYCDPEKETSTHRFRIYGTGNPCDVISSYEYIGSVIMAQFVWHVFLADW